MQCLTSFKNYITGTTSASDHLSALPVLLLEENIMALKSDATITKSILALWSKVQVHSWATLWLNRGLIFVQITSRFLTLKAYPPNHTPPSITIIWKWVLNCPSNIIQLIEGTQLNSYLVDIQIVFLLETQYPMWTLLSTGQNSNHKALNLGLVSIPMSDAYTLWEFWRGTESTLDQDVWFWSSYYVSPYKIETPFGSVQWNFSQKES